MRKHFIFFQILFLIWILMACFGQALATMPEDVAQKVDLLEKKGEFNSARKVLINEYLSTGNRDIFLKWIDLDKALFETVRMKNAKFSIQPWTAYKHSSNETKTEKAIRWGKYGLVGGASLALIPFLGPLAPIAGGALAGGALGAGGAGLQSEYDRRKEFDYESCHPVATLSKIEIQSTLDTYNTLKWSHVEMTRLLDQVIVNAEGAALDDAIDLKQKQKALAEEISTKRCKFVSYDFLSPALNRSKQLIWLSENAKILSIGHSMDYLRQAVEFIGQAGGEQDLILEAEGDIRIEFLEVYRLLKGTAGAAEFEELRVLSGLQDKIGSERSVGYKRWLDSQSAS